MKTKSFRSFLMNFATIIDSPGIILHEFGHKLMCDLTNTKVFEVCWIRLNSKEGECQGFVTYERPNSYWKNVLICLGPLFVNIPVSIMVGLLSFQFKETCFVFFLWIFWIAFSILVNALPSDADMKNIHNFKNL